MIKIPSDNFLARSLKGCCPTYLFIDPYKVIINNIKKKLMYFGWIPVRWVILVSCLPFSHNLPGIQSCRIKCFHYNFSILMNQRIRSI